MGQAARADPAPAKGSLPDTDTDTDCNIHPPTTGSDLPKAPSHFPDNIPCAPKERYRKCADSHLTGIDGLRSKIHLCPFHFS